VVVTDTKGLKNQKSAIERFTLLICSPCLERQKYQNATLYAIYD